MPGAFEIRCPIYGFIPLSSWEREIISQPAFQRLRRIRQLAWTDSVYPGAMHTRFEHSLGVMHMATMLFDGICSSSSGVLTELGYLEIGHARFRQLVRLATLLHDVGHGPFSHAAEDLAPQKEGGNRFKHEEYSAAIIKGPLRDVIENHPTNSNFNFRAEDVAGLIDGTPTKNSGLWQDIVSGQLDADRMDYLLRDSYHAGVEYGKYDWRRIVATVQLIRDPETGTPRLGVPETGRHAVEALIIARYMMFNQIYFHKTRVIHDFHLQKCIKHMLGDGYFPSPLGNDLDEFLKWDDWRVLGRLSENMGGEHGSRLVDRNFYRQVWETSEFPDGAETDRIEEYRELISEFGAVRLDAVKSWYKLGATDLPVLQSDGSVEPLSECSTVVSKLNITRKSRLYVSREHKDSARTIIRQKEEG